MYVWVHNFNVYPTELFFTASLRDIYFFLNIARINCMLQYSICVGLFFLNWQLNNTC